MGGPLRTLATASAAPKARDSDREPTEPHKLQLVLNEQILVASICGRFKQAKPPLREAYTLIRRQKFLDYLKLSSCTCTFWAFGTLFGLFSDKRAARIVSET